MGVELLPTELMRRAISLFGLGYDTVQIADHLSTTEASVANSLGRWREAKGRGGYRMAHCSPWTEDERDIMRKMYAEGKNFRSIALRLQRSRNSVIGAAHRLGLMRVREERRVELGNGKPGMKPGCGYCFPLRPKKVAASGVKDVTPAPTDPQPHERVGLEQLNDKHCRWPLGTVGEPDFGYCGRTPAQNRPYCGAHCKKAYVPVQLTRRTGRPFHLPKLTGMRRVGS